MRMYWVYGPDQKDITIIGLEPHPEDKKNGALFIEKNIVTGVFFMIFGVVVLSLVIAE